METNQPSKPSVSFASLAKDYPVQTKKARKLTDRQELLCKVAYELGIGKQYLSGLWFQCQLLTDVEIIDAKERALTFRPNPGALFRKLIKEKRAEVKEKLK